VPADGGVGTPRFDDGSRVLVLGDELVVEGPAGPSRHPITTVRAAAAVAGVELSSDPGVGHDLPPFEPDAPLAVDRAASLALGEWYAFGATVLGAVRERYGERHTVSEAQLWPEHFDLGLTLTASRGDADVAVNLGASPGDGSSAVPYLYVGPWDRAALTDPFWNAPFGAALPFDDDLDDEARRRATEFVTAGLDRLDIR
jgi:hypothetical protein